MYSKGLVAKSITPISQVLFKLTGQIFIDDMEINITNNRNESTAEIMHRVQRTLDQWHRDLRITGGDLKITKSY